MRNLLMGIWGAAVFSFIYMWATQAWPSSSFFLADPAIFLPLVMLTLSFSVFNRSPNVVRIFHHAVVALALLALSVGVVYLLYFARGSTSAVGAFFLAFGIGVGYVCLLFVSALAYGIATIVRRRA